MPAVTLAGALALAGCGGGSDAPAGGGGGGGGGGNGCDEDEIMYNGSCMTAQEIAEAAEKRGEENASTNTAKAKRAEALVAALGNLGKDESGTDDSNIFDGAPAGAGVIRNPGSSFAGLTDKGDPLKAGTIDGYEYSGKDGPETQRGAIFAIGKTEEEEPITADSNYAGTWVAASERVDVEAITGSDDITGFGNGRTSHDVGASVTGEFFGVPGRYICVAAAGCTVIRNRGTGATTIQDQWHFAPSAGKDAKITVSVDENLRFGWWITESEEGDLEHFTLHLNGRPGTDDDGKGYTLRTASPADTATYRGGAAGQYASHSDDSSDHGAFTAAVELTAEFASDYPTSMVSGTIDGFQVDGKAKPGWEVKLAEQSIAGATLANPFDAGDGNISWHDGDDKIADDGGYFVRGYGGVNTDDSSADVPKALGGMFQVHNDDSRLAGAFGAELDDD